MKKINKKKVTILSAIIGLLVLVVGFFGAAGGGGGGFGSALLSPGGGSFLTPVFFVRSGSTSVQLSSASDFFGIGLESSATPREGLHVVKNAWIEGKADIGRPGAGGGLDVGEGGSYYQNATGTTIVQVFKYDASASSGSRFTEVTDLSASTTWFPAAGDRFYVGSIFKFWAVRFNVTAGKSAEVLQMNYWNGSALTDMDHMGIKKDAATSTGQAILEQTGQKEYVTWDHEINTDWAVADNQLDAIPDTTDALYWVSFQIPSGGIATDLVYDEVRVRGSDFDIVSGASYPVFWGQARLEKHENIALAVVKSPGGVTTANIDITADHKATVFDFNGAGDEISFAWVLPEGIDTSSKIHVTMGYSSSAADTYDLVLTSLNLTNGTAISSSVTATATTTTAITSAAGATLYTGQDLTPSGFSIQDLFADDIVSFELERTDTTNSFYPLVISIHYLAFSNGEHL